MCSTSESTSSGSYNNSNETPKVWLIPGTENNINQPQAYNKVNKDTGTLICSPVTTEPIIESPYTTSKQNKYTPTQVKDGTTVLMDTHLPSKNSLILNNQNNAKNKIFNVDLTQGSFSRLQIEDFPVSFSEREISHETSKIPPLAKIGSSYKSYS